MQAPWLVSTSHGKLRSVVLHGMLTPHSVATCTASARRRLRRRCRGYLTLYEVKVSRVMLALRSLYFRPGLPSFALDFPAAISSVVIGGPPQPGSAGLSSVDCRSGLMTSTSPCIHMMPLPLHAQLDEGTDAQSGRQKQPAGTMAGSSNSHCSACRIAYHGGPAEEVILSAA